METLSWVAQGPRSHRFFCSFTFFQTTQRNELTLFPRGASKQSFLLLQVTQIRSPPPQHCEGRTTWKGAAPTQPSFTLKETGPP